MKDKNLLKQVINSSKISVLSCFYNVYMRLANVFLCLVSDQ